jgi:hypothetical protein
MPPHYASRGTIVPFSAKWPGGQRWLDPILPERETAALEQSRASVLLLAKCPAPTVSGNEFQDCFKPHIRHPPWFERLGLLPEQTRVAKASSSPRRLPGVIPHSVARSKETPAGLLCVSFLAGSLENASRLLEDRAGFRNYPAGRIGFISFLV